MKAELKLEFVAEIGSNWYTGDSGGGLDRAKELINSAASHGADAVKFQLFRADKLNRDGGEAIKGMELPVSWVEELFDHASSRNVEFLCTPFYVEAVRILNPYVKRWKVASWDLTYAPLLDEISKTGKPVILSTGAATTDEIESAVIDHLRPRKEQLCNDITLLHCTGGYPTQPQDMMLVRIGELGAEFFPSHVGLSSHCTDIAVTASSVLYNAELIEVHYDLEDKKGVESGHSYTPSQFAKLVVLANKLRAAQDCDCVMTLSDKVARNMYRRDPSDWLRPVKNPS